MARPGRGILSRGAANQTWRSRLQQQSQPLGVRVERRKGGGEKNGALVFAFLVKPERSCVPWAAWRRTRRQTFLELKLACGSTRSSARRRAHEFSWRICRRGGHLDKALLGHAEEITITRGHGWPIARGRI